jgi:hypothetical protein
MNEPKYIQWTVREETDPLTIQDWVDTFHDCYTVADLEETTARLEAEGKKYIIFSHGVRP